MSSTSSAPSTAKETVSQAVTTPFVQQDECASIYDLISTSIIRGGLGSSVAILVSDAANPRFSSCQPSGWSRGDSVSQFHFSPAVCPSGWTYYKLEVGFYRTTSIELATFSRAFCCASGYQLWGDSWDFPVTSLSTACYRSVDAGATTITATMSDGVGPTQVFTEGYMAHEAWVITWEVSDTATMSPALPSLYGQYVATWLPGQIVTPTPTPEQEHDLQGGDALVRFFMIGIPIIGIAIIGASVWCCIMCRRARRREKQRMQQTFLATPSN